MVVTLRDFIPPRDGDKQQTCPVQSDKTDSDSQVGKFFVKKDHANSTLESGYYSAGLVTGSVVPPPSHQMHTLTGQVSVKEGKTALSSDAEADKGVDSKVECLSQKSNDTDQYKPEDHFVVLLRQTQMLGVLPLIMAQILMLVHPSLTRMGGRQL